MSQVMHLVAAHPGWVSIFESETGGRSYRPVAAFGLVEDNDGKRYLRPYSGDAYTDDVKRGFVGYEYSPHVLQELERADGRGKSTR